MTAPAAAFPPTAPIAAPAAAPLALGWLLCCCLGCVCCCVCVCCWDGVAGGVCDDAWGTVVVAMESAMTNEMTFAEYFIRPPLGTSAPGRNLRSGEATAYIHYDPLPCRVDASWDNSVCFWRNGV